MARPRAAILGAAAAYKAAGEADAFGLLGQLLQGKASSAGSANRVGGGGGPSPAAPAGGGDPVGDGEADKLLGQAKGLVSKNPAQARTLCRKVMQFYNNSPKNPKVQEAYRLLNSIKGGKDDDDDSRPVAALGKAPVPGFPSRVTPPSPF